MYAMKRRALVAIPLAMLALLVLVSPTLAGVSWCRSDPIVRLNGTDVQFWVSVPQEYVHLVDGPIDIVITTPRGVSQEVIFTDPGFNGHGEKVRFNTPRGIINADGSFKVDIRVRVPINDSLLPSGTTVPVIVDLVIHGQNVNHVELGHTNATTISVTVPKT